MKKNDVIFLVGVGLVAGGLVVHHQMNPDSNSTDPSVGLALQPIAPSKMSADSAPLGQRNPAAAPPTLQKSWEKFKDKYGNELQASFSTSGKISTIQGTVQSKPSNGRFHSENEKDAIARAQEVVSDAQDLMGLKKSQPLTHPLYRGSDQYAEVSFQEQIQGIPIAPYGGVTVSLGQDGELKSLYSGYIAEMNIPNISAQNLPQEVGRERAIASIADATDNGKTSNGTLVIWTTPPATPNAVPQGRAAYSYYVQGRQVVVDATTGEVIYRRDKRQF